MKRVLIVDDEKIILDVLQRILTRLGYETVISDSGERALERFAADMFDLVLLDVMMPGMDGFEVAKKMKSSKPKQKIVMVTGMGPEAASSQAHTESVTVQEVLSKPFSYNNVRSVLSQVLGDHGSLCTSETAA